MKDEKYYLVKAEFILKSEDIKHKIMFEHNPMVALELCLKCISELTGDNLFYEQNKKKLGWST